jgi:Putative prokaryotic signal transducing protein
LNPLPRFCPDCARAADPEHESVLCAECGHTLIAQGYCAICESYWRLAVEVPCPKHDVLLEAAPADLIEPIEVDQAVSWVTVRVFPDSLSAAIARSRLEAEGIRTFLEGERMGSLEMYRVATGGVKLQVPAHQTAEARIILSQDWSLPDDERADFEDLL